METKKDLAGETSPVTYNDIIMDLENSLQFDKANFSTMEKNHTIWYNKLCEKYPKDKYIEELKECEEFSMSDIISYIDYFRKMGFSNKQMDEAVKNLYIKHYIWFQYINGYDKDLYDRAMELQGVSYIYTKYIVKLMMENNQLKKENKELSKTNTELLLRPEGPICIELGKKFLLNSAKQQSNED